MRLDHFSGALPASTSRPRRMGPTTTSLAVGLLAIALSACARPTPIVTGSVPNDGYRDRHPIVLTEEAETIDLPVGSQSGRLTEENAATVRAFAMQARARGATGVTVLVPSGSGNEAAAYSMSRQVSQALREGGIAAGAVSHQPYRVEAADNDAPIRLAYPRVVAKVPHRCGEWPANASANATNEDFYNFGCATQSNIAAMVANPADLVTPRGMDAADASRRTTVLIKYRQGTQTKAETGAKENSISSVGGQ